MSGRAIVTLDLSAPGARARVTAARVGVPRVEFDLTLRAAVRAEGGRIVTLLGAEAADALEDERTLVFDDLGAAFPHIENAGVLRHLIRALWEWVERELVSRAGEGLAGRADAHVVVPNGYPPALLESFREACAGARHVTLSGFAHETAALLVGLLRSESFARAGREGNLRPPATVCLFAARGESEIDVACFDYLSEESGESRALVRDHFRTSGDELLTRLRSCDWLGSFSAILLLEDTELGERARARLSETFDAIGMGVAETRLRTDEVRRLKAAGVGQISRAGTAGRGGVAAAHDSEAAWECSIEAAFNLGVRVDQESFYPVFSKHDYAAARDYPWVAFQSFELRGRPGGEVRLGLYCGFSDRVSDATPLGHVSLGGRHLAALAGGTPSALAAIRLDAPGSGEFALYLLPGDELVGSFPFTLPALVA